jgi:hypothetical protein
MKNRHHGYHLAYLSSFMNMRSRSRVADLALALPLPVQLDVSSEEQVKLWTTCDPKTTPFVSVSNIPTTTSSSDEIYAQFLNCRGLTSSGMDALNSFQLQEYTLDDAIRRSSTHSNVFYDPFAFDYRTPYPQLFSDELLPDGHICVKQAAEKSNRMSFRNRASLISVVCAHVPVLTRLSSSVAVGRTLKERYADPLVRIQSSQLWEYEGNEEITADDLHEVYETLSGQLEMQSDF